MGIWYISREGKKAGPFSMEQLSALSKQKKLKQSDLVWKDGMEQWINCLKVPEIEHFFKTSPPNPPSIPVPVIEEQKLPEISNQNDNINKNIEDIKDTDNEDIPVIMVKKKKKPAQKSQSFMTPMRIVLIFGGGFFLLMCSCCLIFMFAFAKGAVKVAEKAAETQAKIDAKSVNGPNETTIEAKIGIPFEIEPGHLLIFNQQGNGSYTTYIEGLVGVGAAQRVHDKVSSIVVIVANITDDGKIWNWKGFSDISSMKDEFGNELQHYIIPDQIIDIGGQQWYLDNRPKSIAPKKQEVYMLAFEFLPETSKQFEVKLKYGKSLIILKGDRGESAKTP